MKKLILALSMLVASTTTIAGDFDLTGNVNLANDYVWRGVTQTDGDFAVSGGLDVSHTSGLYLGTWASNVVGGSEVDVYGGVTNEMFSSGVSYDLGVIKYLYPSQGDLNFHEVYVGLGAELGGMVEPSVKVSHDFSNETYYYEGAVDVALLDVASLNVHYGRTDLSVDDYSFGLSVPVTTLDFVVSYHNSDVDTSRVVLSVGKSF